MIMADEVQKTAKSRWARFRGYFKRRVTPSESAENYHQPAATTTGREPVTVHESALLLDYAATGREPQPSYAYRELATSCKSATCRETADHDVSQQMCSEEHLAEIATSIVKWREISPFLGLTESEEHEILGAIPPLSVLEQKIAMLRLWKKKKGKAATYNRLCQAFRISARVDLDDKMKQILAESKNLVGEGEFICFTLSMVIL